MSGEIWFALGVAMVIGAFMGMVQLIKKRQADPRRCYPNQDETFPWGV